MKYWNTIIVPMTLALALFLAVSGASAASAAWDGAEQVRRLNSEAPSLYGYGDAEALVWLEDNNYKMRVDGAMEITRSLIVMLGERVPKSLKDIRIPVPRGGEVEITEAAWYNPMTAIKEGTVQTGEERLPGGTAVRIISVPESAVGRAVVIVTHEVHPSVYGVSGFVAMSGPLPRWEQNLTVEVSEGQELFWTGRDAGEPRVAKDQLTRRYTWNVMNQQPWHGEGFVEYRRPFVAFGVKNGIGQALAAVERYAHEIKTPPLPVPVGGDRAKTGLRLMEWTAANARTLKGYPADWIRPNEEIPDEGPWTRWEQTLILNKWLQMIGWDSEVWWQEVSELDENVPAAEAMFVGI